MVAINNNKNLEGATYVAPGEDLQAVFNAVPDGGTVVLRKGMHRPPTGRRFVELVDKNQVRIQGEAGAILSSDGAINPPGVLIVRGGVGNVVRRLTLAGAGLHIRGGARGTVVRNVDTRNGKSWAGFFIDEGSTGSRIIGCTSTEDSRGFCVGWHSVKGGCGDTRLMDCRAQRANGGASPGNGDGFQVQGLGTRDVTLIRCYAEYCTDDGYDVGNDCRLVYLEDCVAMGMVGLGDGTGFKFGTHEPENGAGGDWSMSRCSVLNARRGIEVSGPYRDRDRPEGGTWEIPLLKLRGISISKTMKYGVYAEFAKLDMDGCRVSQPEESEYATVRLHDESCALNSTYCLYEAWPKDAQGLEIKPPEGMGESNRLMSEGGEPVT